MPGDDRRVRLDQPREPRRVVPRPTYDAEAFGRLSETVARFLGTGRFLVIQTGLIALWVVFNTLPGVPHFDPYTFTFLTLILSLQAAYAAPLILLAQNRQDDRDRVNLEQDRGQSGQIVATTEYLAREVAALRIALGEVATRDFIRSEIIRLLDERDSAARDGGPRPSAAEPATRKPDRPKRKKRERAQPGDGPAEVDSRPLSEPQRPPEDEGGYGEAALKPVAAGDAQPLAVARQPTPPPTAGLAP